MTDNEKTQSALIVLIILCLVSMGLVLHSMSAMNDQARLMLHQKTRITVLIQKLQRAENRLSACSVRSSK